VLHVIDSLGISGGAEKHLARNLASFDNDLLRHEVALVQSAGSTRRDELPGHVAVHELFDPNEQVTRPALVSRLRRLVQGRRPSLMHASLPNAALATRIVAATSKVAAVESLVNISHEPVRTVDNPNVTMTKLRAHAAIDRVTMRFLTGYHAVSHEVAESWSRTVGLDPEKIEVIPRGIEIDAVEIDAGEREGARRSIRSELGFDDSALVLLAVGRVEPQKGHRYLVEATAEIAPEHPEVRVLIVGRPGHSSSAVDEAIQVAGLRDVVRLTGARRDLPKILAAADIFVFPSLFEGNGGNAMIEAMAAGLPIVTTGAPPMTDLIPSEEFGLLVGRSDTHGLALALDRLLDDPGLRRRLGDAARARAMTFATPDEIAKSHESWYLRLLSS